MSYHYTDASREADPYALPDVEVFRHAPRGLYKNEGGAEWCNGEGYYYARGSSGFEPDVTGYLFWDSDPIGPHDTEEQALAAAREAAGFCAHGVSIENDFCETCPDCPTCAAADDPECFDCGGTGIRSD